jgi:uncharacterized repeat protein (TIGR03803 family)
MGPDASLIAVHSRLYGTTAYGGNQNAGTLFSLDRRSAAETVLYSFCSQANCADGGFPDTNIIEVAGALYGETQTGGTHVRHQAGILFSYNLGTGTETVLYSFCSRKDCNDGAYPNGGLLALKGRLYDTTEFGGAHVYGTVFFVRYPE